MTTQAPARPASDAQKRFLNKLRVERGYAPIHDDDFGDLRTTSAAIDTMKALPPRPGAAARPTFPDLADLAACKYLVDGDRGQKVHVEIVERRGGRKFFNLLVGAPGDWRRDRVSAATQTALVAKIRTATYHDAIGQRDLTGPEAAAVRFSREHKCCAACMSPLSDESQPGYAFGLGPVCRTRFGH